MRTSTAVLFARRRRRGSTGTVTVVLDTFTRADNPASPGSTESGTAGILPWIAERGTWGVIGNQLYCPTPHATLENVVVVASGAANCTVRGKMAVGAAADERLCVRETDNLNYLVIGSILGATSFDIAKIVAGAGAVLTSGVYAWADGDFASAICAGSGITGQANDVTKATTSDAFNASATRHGFSTPPGVVGSTRRYDQFTVTVP